MTEHAIGIRRLCATHRGPHAPLAEPGLHVCHHCLTRLIDTLTDLPRLLTQVTELELTSRDGSSGGAGRNSTPPARLDVIALLDPRSGPDPDLPPAAGIIADWATLVTDQRRYRTAATTTDRLDVLIRNTTWIVADPDLAAEFTHDMTLIHTALRRVCRELSAPVATCQRPHPDPQADGECGGNLIYDPTSDAYPVRCVRCGDRWSRTALDLGEQQLRRRLEQGA